MAYCDQAVGGEYVDTALNFTGTNAADAIFCYWSDTVGGLLFLLVIFGVAFIGIYEFSESMSLPVIIVILVGVTVLPVIPGVGVSFFQGVLAIIIAAAVLIVLRRMERNTN